MSSYNFRWPHAMAVLGALAGYAFQSATVLESLGPNPALVDQAGAFLAPALAAVLPVLGEAAWRNRQHAKSMFMALTALVLMGYVLPTGFARLGERQETRIERVSLSAGELESLEADRVRSRGLVRQSEEWVADECRSGGGPRCKGQTFTLNQRKAYLNELEAKIAAAKGQHVAKPWLPAWHPALLTLGVELAIVSMLFYGLGPLTHAATKRVEPASVPLETAVLNAIDYQPKAQPEEITEEELEHVRDVVGIDGVNNRHLAKLLGCSEGQASKLATEGVARGKLTRTKIGREVRIAAA